MAVTRIEHSIQFDDHKFSLALLWVKLKIQRQFISANPYCQIKNPFANLVSYVPLKDFNDQVKNLIAKLGTITICIYCSVQEREFQSPHIKIDILLLICLSRTTTINMLPLNITRTQLNHSHTYEIIHKYPKKKMIHSTSKNPK